MSGTINVIDEVKNNFLVSSLDTNINRAFPDVRDGLKPGQRACLWEMHRKGYSSKKPHVKSAKVSGGVIADTWPHGDVAVYDTFARMSQSFVNNNPEIDFHGANGNLIVGDDGVANQRYTEVRLSSITEEGILWNLDKDVVDFRPNFSNDAEWPVVLPSFFPRLLVNGTQGIGVGIANVWVSHNLGDVIDGLIKYIQTGEVDNSLKPDFPTGGVIINSDELEKINTTGKGRIIIRGKAEIKGNEIHISELPFQVYVKPFIEDIREKIEKGTLQNIIDVSDRSDINQLKVVIECVSPALAPKVLEMLYNSTDLQTQINANQIAIINDNTPKLLTLGEVYSIIVQHNLSVLQRAAQFDINKLEEELYKLKTIKAAIDDIDTVVYIIKDVDNIQEQHRLFKEKFGFCEAQMDMVSKMRLSTLMKTNRDKLAADIAEKTKKVEYLQKYLNSDEMQKQDLIDKITSIKNKYNTPKRTTCTNIELAGKGGRKKKEQPVVRLAVSIDNKGYIKSCPAAMFRKSKTIISSVLLNSDEMVYLFSSLGKLYRVKANTIKQVPKGTPVVNVVNLTDGEEILFITSDKNSENHLLTSCTKSGIIKKMKFEECAGHTQNKKGLSVMKLKDGDRIIFVQQINKEKDFIILTTKKAYKINLDEIRTLGKAAAGRRIVKDKVVSAGFYSDMSADIRERIK